VSIDHQFVPDLAALVPEVPADAILSRTFHEDERLKVILFAFAPGQELSEHTASEPAILHFLAGEAALTLGKDEHQAHAGTWAYMPARLPHGVRANTRVLMLLTLYKA
jgi:quercetin dioxygenase-like cupin family protein